MYYFCLIFLTVPISLALSNRDIGCSIGSFGTGFIAPLYLRPGVTYDLPTNYSAAFLLPNSKTGKIDINLNEKVRFACPGSNLTVNRKPEAIATCKGNNIFQTDDLQNLRVEQLNCSTIFKAVSEKRDYCAYGASGIEIGFQLEKFYPILYTCFDESAQYTHYSKVAIPPGRKLSAEELESIEMYDDFEDDFITFNIEKAYKYDNQVASFSDILRSKELAQAYVKNDNQFSLSRGHFVANADFVIESHRQATYHYINAGPQWQVFNGGVWMGLENAVRQLANDRNVQLITYTGPLGLLSYMDYYGFPEEMYLFDPETGEPRLQVPKFFWKIVYEPITKTGTAFIGINDPYVSLPYTEDYVICEDVSEYVTWFQDIVKNKTWLYACNVRDFVTLSPLTLPG